MVLTRLAYILKVYTITKKAFTVVQVHWRLCNKGVIRINYVNCVAPTSLFYAFWGEIFHNIEYR